MILRSPVHGMHFRQQSHAVSLSTDEIVISECVTSMLACYHHGGSQYIITLVLQLAVNYVALADSKGFMDGECLSVVNENFAYLLAL